MQFNQAPAPRESSLGDAYDPTANYSVDDLCIHDNVLYKCISPISGGEAWNPEHWTETNIGDEIKAVNSKLSDTGWLDLSSDGKAKYRKIGKIVHLNFVSNFDVQLNNEWKLLYTLPEGFRPSYQISNIPITGGSQRNNTGVMRVETGGEIYAFGYTNSNYFPANTISFMVD